MGLHDTETGTHPPGAGLHWVPVTRLARVGLGGGVAGFLLMPAWMLFGPFGAFPQLALMLAGGVCCLIAILRQHERAILAFVGLAPLTLVLIFIVGEFAFPH
jgi:hypothetical protein